MRVNVYAEEITDRVEIVEKNGFTGVRFWLELPVTVVAPREGQHSGTQTRGPFIHQPGDDDSAAVTFWGKAELKVALRKALALLEDHNPNGCGGGEVVSSSIDPRCRMCGGKL